MGFSSWESARPQEGCSTTALPASPRGLLELVVIATELYQTITLAMGRQPHSIPRGSGKALKPLAKSWESFQQVPTRADLSVLPGGGHGGGGPGLDDSPGRWREIPSGPAVAHATSDAGMSRFCRGTLGHRATWGGNRWHQPASLTKLLVSLESQEVPSLCQPPPDPPDPSSEAPSHRDCNTDPIRHVRDPADCDVQLAPCSRPIL